MAQKSSARILFVEDMPADAELAKREIRKSGIEFSWQRVDTQEAFLKALKEFKPEIIISDYTMPTFDGRRALKLAQQWDPAVPVIILTGSINEETAVDCLKSGAMDYIIKEHIVRLPFAVREALEKRKTHLARESAEQALRKSESSLQAILHSTADGILAVGAENKVLFANTRFTMMWNIPQNIVATNDDALLLKAVLDQLVNPESFVKKVQQLYRSNEESFDTLDFKDGRVFERSSRPLLERGTVMGRVWSFRDVTDRKRAEEAIRESESRFRALFTLSPDALYVHVDERVVLVNPALCKLLGANDPSQLIGKSVLDIVHPEYHRKLRERWKLVFKGEPAPLLEEKFLRLDGSLVDVEVSAVAIDWQGSRGVQVIVRDITERKRMEEAILYEQSLLRSILDNVPDHVYFKDKESRFLKISRSLAGSFGYGDPMQAIGKTDLDFFSLEHSQKARKDEHHIIQSGKAIVDVEEKETWPDGRETWVSTTKMPLQNTQGQIIGTFGISRDITERKHSAEVLRENEEFFRLMFTTSPDAILLFDPNSTPVPWEIVDCNEVACRMNGYTREELLGKSVDMLTTKTLTDEERVAYRKVLEEQGVRYYETTHRHRDGHMFSLEVSTSIIVRDGRELVLGIDRDITERKRSEEVLRENEEFFRLLFTASPDAILLFDPNSTRVPWEIVDCNEVACRMNGYTREELIGKSVDMLNTTTATREERDAYRTLVEEKGINCFETVHRHHDGHIFPIEVAAAIVVRGGRQLLLGIDRDITERKRSEQALQNKERYQRALLDNFPFGVWLKDKESRFLAVNELFAKTFSVAAADELVGKTDFDIMPANIAEVYRAHDRAVLESRMKSVSEGELEGLGKNKFFETYKAPVMGPNDEVLGTVGFLRDITERKMAEEEQQKNEALMRTTVENLPLIFYIVDPHGTFKLSIGAGLQGLGLKPNQVVGQSVFDVYKDHPNIIDFIKRALNGQSVEFESNVAGSSFANFVAPYSTAKGIAAGIVGVALDITESKRAQEALRESEERYRGMFENVQDVYYESSLDGTILELSPSIAMLSKGQYHREELIGKSMNDFYDRPKQRDAFLAEIQARGRVTDFEITLRNRDGSLFTASVSASIQTDKRSGAQKLIGSLRDVTERKKAEETRLLLTTALESTANGVAITDLRGDLVWINKAFSDMTGYSRTEVLGQNPRFLKSGKQNGVFYKQLWETISAGKAWHGELINRKKDGSLYIDEMMITPLENSDGKLTNFIAVKQDITERKRAEERINLLAHTIRSIGECVTITDLKDQILFVNHAFLRTYGYSEQEILGKNINIIGSPNNPPQVSAEMRNAARQKGWQGELLNRAKDGREFPISLSTSVVHDEEGRAVALVGVATDITERRRVEDALTDERNLLRALMDNVPDQVYFKDTESRFLRISRCLANHFGLGDPAQAVGKSDFDFFSEEHARPAFEDEKKIMKSGMALVGVEEKESWADGRETWVSTTKVPLQDAEGRILGTFGISRDITKNKQAEKALMESEERYKSLFERNLAATFVSTPSGKVLECNPAYLDMFGFKSYEQALAANMSGLYADQRNRDMVLTSLRDRKKVENLELRMVKTDGTQMFIIANLVGKFDEQGQLTQKTGYLIDDTKRHGLEKELIQSQKLESLGILAGGIAHDFNNILGILMGHVSLLDRIQDNPELHKTSLGAIDTALKRGTGLVRQLLTFARKTDAEFAPILVNDVVKELIKLLRETLPRTIEIVADLNPKLPAIVADGGQIHQVLLNLCVNAKDAMHAGGRLRVQTSLVEGSRLHQRFPNVAAEKYVSIEVQDSGTGMDEATKTRIFEPFFTTKELGKGTGLGLAVVFGVVQTHKGYIDVESEIGKGSTFRVYLPVEETHPEVKISRARFEDSQGGSETILIVEDEALLYETTKMTLASKGYVVLYAKDGLEALDVYRNHHKDIGLVLTDMDLPKLGGEKLIETLIQINPKLKIVFASGYVDPEVKERVLRLGVKAFLPKPYDPITLLGLVRQVLDAKV